MRRLQVSTCVTCVTQLSYALCTVRCAKCALTAAAMCKHAIPHLRPPALSLHSTALLDIHLDASQAWRTCIPTTIRRSRRPPCSQPQSRSTSPAVTATGSSCPGRRPPLPPSLTFRVNCKRACCSERVRSARRQAQARMLLLYCLISKGGFGWGERGLGGGSRSNNNTP
jgi:hypothetical protein